MNEPPTSDHRQGKKWTQHRTTLGKSPQVFNSPGLSKDAPSRILEMLLVFACCLITLVGVVYFTVQTASMTGSETFLLSVQPACGRLALILFSLQALAGAPW